MTDTMGIPAHQPPSARAAWDTYLALTDRLLPALAGIDDRAVLNAYLGAVVIRIRRYAPMWGGHGPMLIAAAHSAVRLYRDGDDDALTALLQVMAQRIFALIVTAQPGDRRGNSAARRYDGPDHGSGPPAPRT